MTRVVVVFVIACAEAPPVAPVVTAPDPIVGQWTIVDHVLTPSSDVTDSDAQALHGRIVEISAGGYISPWHGTCGEAGRELAQQVTMDLEAIHNYPLQPFKLLPNVVEYVFTCVDNKRAPPLTIDLENNRAVTCWNGACYLLARRR